MRTVIGAIILSASLALAQTDAPIIQNNPTMATYQAQLQANLPIQGQITGVSGMNGTGVTFNTNFFDYPADGAPYEYQIHELPVPSSGSCDATGAPLDPYKRGTSPICNAVQPATCQLGDLSGKHGNITYDPDATSFQKLYLDLYLSTIPGNEAYFGNRSIVIQASNGTRVNCANFVGQGSAANASASASSSMAAASSTASSAASSGASSTAKSTVTSSGTSTAAATSATHSGAAAAQKVMNTGALVAAIAALVL